MSTIGGRMLSSKQQVEQAAKEDADKKKREANQKKYNPPEPEKRAAIRRQKESDTNKLQRYVKAYKARVTKSNATQAEEPGVNNMSTSDLCAAIRALDTEIDDYITATNPNGPEKRDSMYSHEVFYVNGDLRNAMIAAMLEFNTLNSRIALAGNDRK